MVPTMDVVLGYNAFGIFWALALFPIVTFLPIGRTIGSLLGAMLMVIFCVISPKEAYVAIDLPILATSLELWLLASMLKELICPKVNFYVGQAKVVRNCYLGLPILRVKIRS